MACESLCTSLPPPSPHGYNGYILATEGHPSCYCLASHPRFPLFTTLRDTYPPSSQRTHIPPVTRPRLLSPTIYRASWVKELNTPTASAWLWPSLGVKPGCRGRQPWHGVKTPLLHALRGRVGGETDKQVITSYHFLTPGTRLHASPRPRGVPAVRTVTHTTRPSLFEQTLHITTLTQRRGRRAQV